MSIVPDLNPNAVGGVACALAALVYPSAYCPGCLAEAGEPWPEGATSRTCPRCLAHLRRVWQVQRWNADHQHQVLAGKARAQQFTSEYQQAAAFASPWRPASGREAADAHALAAPPFGILESVPGACGAYQLTHLGERVAGIALLNVLTLS